MRYNGYTGSVEYSEEDNCLFGEVLGLHRDCVIFEGKDLNELRQDFETAVDDYLEGCKADGREPEKPYSGSLNVRLSPELHGMIAELARNNGITINAFIRKSLEDTVNQIHSAALCEGKAFYGTRIKKTGSKE